MKLHPEIILEADRNGLPVNGFRLWFIVRDICKGGGTVPVKALRNHLKALRVSRATYSRWLGDSLNLGLLERLHSKRTGEDYYKVANTRRAAEIAGCKELDTPILISAEALIVSSWHSLVLAAYEKRFEHRPISRATIERLTGVPRRTQQYREKQAGVRQIKNIGVYGSAAQIAQDNPDLLIDRYDSPGVFTDQETGRLCKQLPNTRVIPGTIQRANRGRTNKVNKQLAALLQRDAVAKERRSRQYAFTSKQAKRLMRLEQRNRTGNSELYELGQVFPNGAQGWMICTA